jgi:carnitine 3-dehydrogenase
MTRTDPTQVRRVAIIGTGVIGSGWAAHFLRQGLEVIAYDPAPQAEARLRQRITTVWPTLERLGLNPQADPSRLTFAPDIASAVSEAEFVQENVPERTGLKSEVFNEIDAATLPTVVIASSTSGLPLTTLQKGCRHPERCVVGHPFNPPILSRWSRSSVASRPTRQ